MKKKIIENLEERKHDGELDRADAVQNVLIIAGFAVVVILLLAWIGKAVKDKGAQAASCVEGENTYSTASINASKTKCLAKKGKQLGSINNGAESDAWLENGYDAHAETGGPLIIPPPTVVGPIVVVPLTPPSP